MTTKYLSGRYPDGYTLSAGYGELVIERTARVYGDGITTPFAATVVNQGTVAGASHGVDMEAGGSLVNGSTTNTGASIDGGVIASGAANVINFGTIHSYDVSGVDLEAGGSIRNGSIHDTTAQIVGSDGVASTAAADVVNFGKIVAYDRYSGVGVSLRGGGSLTNGSTLDTTAFIGGYLAGVEAATIANFGTIGGSGAYHAAIDLLAGGTLSNGSAHDTTALISSPQAVKTEGDATVVNFGTIDGGVYLSSRATITNGSQADTGAAIDLVYARSGVATIANFGVIESVYLSGGSLTNGSAGDSAARITGGVSFSSGAAAIVNFTTIVGESSAAYAVRLGGGGTITNGSAADAGASISGVTANGAVTVNNFGTIAGVTQSDAGVVMSAGGMLTNGSAADSAALISGYYYGVTASGAAATIVNFGKIVDKAEGYGDGARLRAGGSIINGSKADATALIYGYRGLEASDGATIVNYGTIDGFGGVAVSLSTADCEVIAEAGSTFIGGIEGGGGTLVLAGGSGTIRGLGAGGTLTGAVQASFIHVNTFMIGSSGSWTLAGPNKVDPVADLIDAGTLINRGALSISGTLSVGAGGVFSLAGGSIAAGPTGAARIVDNGLVIGQSATTITVGAYMIDRGVVEVATGTLDFTSRLFGTGVLKIDAGATLEADAGAISTLTASFAGGAATLALKRPNTFDATLAGFATGDIIDLLGLKATAASVNGADQLVVVNGAATVATLQLSGNYAGATFTTAADGHGGTNVALAPGVGPDLASVHGTAPVMAPTAAPLHAFIFAMAGLGGTTASHATPGAPWAPRATLLSAPHAAMV